MELQGLLTEIGHAGSPHIISGFFSGWFRVVRTREVENPGRHLSSSTASRSILRAQPFSSTAAIFLSSNTTARFLALPKNNRNPNLVRPFSSTFPRNSTFPGKCLHFHRFAAFSSLSSAKDQNPSQELAVLLEVDGVLLDADQLGNQSFNEAFKKVGLGYEYWTEPLYLGLLRTSAGDEEKMLNLYFNSIG
ncbi:uncharacterized protein [Malus domestica]|uniref:uncharacterized protein n=1 Tax=Malus domestica TaxID=3750 RepID=UPI0007ECD9EA